VIPAAFEYAKASSVEEAVKLLNKYGEDASRSPRRLSTSTM